MLARDANLADAVHRSPMLQEGPDHSHVSQLGRAAQGLDRQFRNGARLQQQHHQFAVPANGGAVQGSLALL